MIKQINASLWFNKEESVATAYVEINQNKDSVVFTFRGKDQVDGVIQAHRVRSKLTKKTISGITAELVLPEDDSMEFDLKLSIEGEAQPTVELKPNRLGFNEDGTRNYNRPVADGSYKQDNWHFFNWLEETKADPKTIELQERVRNRLKRD